MVPALVVNQVSHVKANLNYDISIFSYLAPAPKETVWAKRQQEQEVKQAAIQELLPGSEYEEQAMLKRALELSERTAREEEARKKYGHSMLIV